MDSKIKVALRCRPYLPNELNRRKAITFTSDSATIGDKRYPFEQVFDESSTQEGVYDFCVRSLVDGCFEGYNGTVFAYGQTGSGKTYSIMGGMAASEDVDAGIIPRAVRQIFDNLHSASGISRMATVRVSMIELYNDECKDLLHPEIPSRDIMIREDKHGRMFFTGAREEIVNSAATALQYLEIGNINRSTAETLMNQASSRSHAIFTISLEIVEYSKNADDDEESSFIHAKLHLVDLAGSERAKKTGASGQRLKESVGINQGLLSLGKVIRALTTHPVTHVPYRESKLTRFLQDSLGGNSRTVLLACISPSELSLNETINTIQYAQRAKAIHNKVVANVATGIASSELQSDLESSLVVSLRAEIVRMQREFSSTLTNNNTILNGGDGSSSSPRNASHQLRLLKQRHHHQQQLLRSIHKHLQTAQQQQEQQLPPSPWTAAHVRAEPAAFLECFEYTVQMQNKFLSLISQAHSDDYSNSEMHSNHGNMLRKSLRESWNEFHGKAAAEGAEEELARLREELDDCREDLKRDEEIFAEKMKELKKAKKLIKDLEAEKATLSERVQTMRQQLIKLSRLPKLFVNNATPAESDLLSSPTKAPRSASKKEPRGTPPQSDKDKDKQKDKEKEMNLDLDLDLDVSIAVAMSEPDISQLMEDFEAVWQEKEDLRSNRQHVEENLARVAAVAQMQREKIAAAQLQLQHKVRVQASKLRDQTHELSLLQEQLRQLRDEQHQNASNASSSSATVQNAQQQLLEETQQKMRRMTVSIQELSQERNDLLLQVRELESQLTARSQEQRVVAEEHQRRVHTLEEQIQKLRDEVQIVNEQAAKVTSEGHRNTPNSNKKQKSTSKSPRKASNQSLRMSRTEQVDSWLEESLNMVVQEGIAQIDVLRLQKTLDVLLADRDAAMKELATLKPSSSTSQLALDKARQAPEIIAIDDKLKALQLKATTLRMKQQQISQSGSDPQQLESTRKALQDVEYNIASYEEHRAEFLERLVSSAAIPATATMASPDKPGSSKKKKGDSHNTQQTQQQIVELQDDLDAMQTEISALESRLVQEKERTRHLQEQNYKRFNIRDDDEDASDNDEDHFLKDKDSSHGDRAADTRRLSAGTTKKGNGSGSPKKKRTKKKRASFALEAIVKSLVQEMRSYHRHIYLADDQDATTDTRGHASESSEETAAAVDELFERILSLHIKHRIKAGAHEGSWLEAKQQLEAKCAEYDGLVQHMQRLRNDALKKQTQLRREADEKVAFLVQQLRQMESQLQQQPPSHANTPNSGHGRHSTSSSTAAATAVSALPLPPRPVSSHSTTSNTRGRATSPEEESEAVLSARSDTSQSNHGASMLQQQQQQQRLLRLSQKKSLSDLLLHHHQQAGAGGQMDDVEGLNQEVLKRWVSEKERREQLERRNAEMARELREMKQQGALSSRPSSRSSSVGREDV